jgi:hypothetical protein
LSQVFQLFFISAKFYVLLNYAKSLEAKNLSKFLVLKNEKKRIKVQSAQLFEVKFGANSGYYQQNSFPHQI